MISGNVGKIKIGQRPLTIGNKIDCNPTKIIDNTVVCDKTSFIKPI